MRRRLGHLRLTATTTEIGRHFRALLPRLFKQHLRRRQVRSEGGSDVDRIYEHPLCGTILISRLVATLLSRFRRYAAILVGINVAILVVASWTPSEEMVRTEVLSGWAEHAIAYLASGLSTTVLLKGRLSPLHITVALVFLAALLEAGQLFAPGRQAKLSDFAVSAVAGVAGILLGSLFTYFEARLGDGRARQP